jgi:thiol-disulfide isomerase/thioredoxin
MKIKFIALTIILSFQISILMAQEKYNLKGFVKGIPEGTVEMSYYDFHDRTSSLINNGTVQNGKFEISGKLKGPLFVSLTFKPGNWSTSVFLENSNITVEGDTTGAEHYDYTAYGQGKGARLTNIAIKGSNNQDIYDRYQSDTSGSRIKTALLNLNKAYYKSTSEIEKEQIKGQIGVEAAKINIIQKKLLLNLLAQKPDAAATAFLIYNYYQQNSKMPLDTLEDIIAGFSGSARKSPYFAQLQLEVKERKAVLPGTQIEDFTLLKKDSSSFTLSSLRGKYVMIDFWASWCKPCREAIPHWKTIYSKYKDKGFEIISVTNDSRRSDWIKAMDAEMMPWLQLTDEFPKKNMPARVISRFKSGFIPLYVLIDQKGKILLNTGSEEEIDAKLAELFKS